MNTIKSRISQLIEEENISVAEFERRSGLSNGYTRNFKGNLGAEKLEGILRGFPNLSRDWLLYGEGSMLKGAEGVAEDNNTAILVADDEESYRKAINSGMKLIPEYSTPFYGGDGLIDSAEYIVAYWSLPDVPPNSQVITMYGDSMSPYIRSGSKLVIQPISFSNPMEIPFGNVFALSVRDDWGQVSTHVKIIRRHNDKAKEYTHWIARSVNRDNYDDFDIDISRVMSLSIMVAFVNRAL